MAMFSKLVVTPWMSADAAFTTNKFSALADHSGLTANHALHALDVDVNDVAQTITMPSGFVLQYGVFKNAGATNAMYVVYTTLKADGTDSAVEARVDAGGFHVVSHVKSGTNIQVKCATGLTTSGSWAISGS